MPPGMLRHHARQLFGELRPIPDKSAGCHDMLADKANDPVDSSECGENNPRASYTMP